MDPKKVGKTIAFLRNYYGMTQRELAERLGVTDKAVSRWECGQGTPDISLLGRLSNVLDTDIESILEGNLTHIEIKWKGILVLNYAEGIFSWEQMFGIRIIEFQVGFFMLAGIKDICVFGNERELDYVRNYFKVGERYGIHLEYVVDDSRNFRLSYITSTSKFKEYYRTDGIMLINGLDFLYGKDVTKFFRKVIYDEKYPVNVANYKQKPTSIYFFPKTKETKKALQEDISKKLKSKTWERGVIVFPILSQDDLYDAASIIRILEKHHEEVANLEEIAARRTLVKG